MLCIAKFSRNHYRESHLKNTGNYHKMFKTIWYEVISRNWRKHYKEKEKSTFRAFALLANFLCDSIFLELLYDKFSQFFLILAVWQAQGYDDNRRQKSLGSYRRSLSKKSRASGLTRCWFSLCTKRSHRLRECRPRMSENRGSSSIWYLSKYSNSSSVPSTLPILTNWKVEEKYIMI